MLWYLGVEASQSVLARRIHGWWSIGSLVVGIALVNLLVAADSRAGALEDYVNAPDSHYGWKELARRQADGFTIAHLKMTSQEWRGHLWQHDLQVVQPDRIRNPDLAFIFITGNGDGAKSLGLLKTVAARAGAVAAVVTWVPNQPLYGGRSEDALIAYTFDRYLKTGDPTWPLLFPMVKSAVKAMDAVTDLVKNEKQPGLTRFVLSGASKRGWTTWLTGAVDPRVTGIAPMVIDMLNMQAQVRWADQVYGRQSEKIHDYTDLGLIARMDDPAMAKLREWVDPYSYRQRYRMPKLILLGTNDPYWTVDSLRFYWDDLPEPKLIYQTPNAGHGLNGGAEATQTLAAFVRMIADHQSLPKFTWQFGTNSPLEVAVEINPPSQSAQLWSASSADRDFRDEQWSVQRNVKASASQYEFPLATPARGYRAYLVQVVMKAADGHEYRLSTQARVTPDGLRQPPTR